MRKFILQKFNWTISVSTSTVLITLSHWLTTPTLLCGLSCPLYCIDFECLAGRTYYNNFFTALSSHKVVFPVFILGIIFGVIALAQISYNLQTAFSQKNKYIFFNSKILLFIAVIALFVLSYDSIYNWIYYTFHLKSVYLVFYDLLNR